MFTLCNLRIGPRSVTWNLLQKRIKFVCGVRHPYNDMINSPVSYKDNGRIRWEKPSTHGLWTCVFCYVLSRWWKEPAGGVDSSAIIGSSFLAEFNSNSTLCNLHQFCLPLDETRSIVVGAFHKKRKVWSADELRARQDEYVHFTTKIMVHLTSISDRRFTLNNAWTNWTCIPITIFLWTTKKLFCKWQTTFLNWRMSANWTEACHLYSGLS